MTDQEAAFRWVHVRNKDELEAFYLSVLPKIRLAAKECGYAIGLHGSLRRDLDLIAAPWTDAPLSGDELAVKIHRAACGIERQKYHWEKKPRGRAATSFPVCWTDWNEPNVGHIDLSVVDPAELAQLEAVNDDLFIAQLDKADAVIAAARAALDSEVVKNAPFAGYSEALSNLREALSAYDEVSK